MADTPPLTDLRRSPLQHLTEELAAAATPSVSIRERPFRAMVALRCDPAGPVPDRVAGVLGDRLPTSVGGVSAGETSAIWMGPDEWLVHADASPAALVDRLTGAVGDGRGAVVDVSANRTTVEVTGPRARHLLEKGCSVDLHPRAFGPGHAVPTDVAGVQTVVWQVDDQTWRLLPRCSFADHLVRWMVVNVQEYATTEGA